MYSFSLVAIFLENLKSTIVFVQDFRNTNPFHGTDLFLYHLKTPGAMDEYQWNEIGYKSTSMQKLS